MSTAEISHNNIFPFVFSPTIWKSSYYLKLGMRARSSPAEELSSLGKPFLTCLRQQKVVEGSRIHCVSPMRSHHCTDFCTGVVGSEHASCCHFMTEKTGTVSQSPKNLPNHRVSNDELPSPCSPHGVMFMSPPFQRVKS